MTLKFTKVPISELALSPPSQSLSHCLTPDPNEPTPSVFIRDVLQNRPSIQRRARILSGNAHFTYVSPMPLEFPYEIPAIPSSGTDDKAMYIENWLKKHEATLQAEGALEQNNASPNGLTKFVSEARDETRVLIGLSETSLRDCLPHLDVGDAFDVLGRPALLPASSDSEGVREQEASSSAGRVRQELIDVLSGHAVLMSADAAADGKGYAPWSLRYSGHQFGTWAGQLGDGRAISIRTVSTPHPTREGVSYELQLKGAGRTPFSRTADGLAVLRSSIREYLCSEAMHALSIPTTRSLSLVYLPELRVLRETIERACVCTRVAESFIRIGNFEALSPPVRTFFLGGGQQDADYDALRVLGEWVVKKVLKLETVNIDAGDAWGKALVFEVAHRNARMVAAWQAYGFMHGVINTDNVSVMGLTIDYGPYAFMDVFDPYHICNHSDSEGRYAYMNQPNMIIYACRALLNALAPLIGAEMCLGNKAVKGGWADDVSSDTLQEWRTTALEQTQSEMERILQEACAVEYNLLLRKRLGLRLKVDNDQSIIFEPLFDLVERQRLDFHGTFRRLSAFRRGMVQDSENVGELGAFIDTLLQGTSEPNCDEQGRGQWVQWLKKYANRIDLDASEWAIDYEVARERAMKAVNPRFVLRQWVLEEVIKKVETDPSTGRRVLAKVLEMACSPFEPWGAEGDDSDAHDAEIREERRYCVHTLRIHQQPVLAVFVSSDNERIYSGDTKGRLVVTSTRSLRAIADWQAHKDGLLSIQEFNSHIITHGRDNKLHVWQRPSESVPIRRGGAASLTDQPPPPLCYSLDINALNFCRFSLLPGPNGEALLAVPNLVESALADIWTLPDRTRLHAAIGDPADTSVAPLSDGRSGRKSGIIMAMHLYYPPLTVPSTSTAQRELWLLCAYEDGGVVLHRRTAPEGTQTVQGKGWDVVWKRRLHVESVMAMAVASDHSFALTVSADHIVGRYDLNASTQAEAEQSTRVFRTKHPGNGAVAIRDDGRVCAVGNWDGRIRLYSTKSFKSLGTLVYHKENCHALSFASTYSGTLGHVSDEDDMTDEEKRQRGQWLIAAGKDNRVSIWGLMSFEKGTTGF